MSIPTFGKPYTMYISPRLKCSIICIIIYVSGHVHVLMRDEKELRKKQTRSNKQQEGKATQHTQGSHFS